MLAHPATSNRPSIRGAQLADAPIPYSGPVVTRAAAKAAGLKRYFTGTACKFGHVDERSTRTGNCAECAKRYFRTYYVAHSETIKSRSARRRRENPEYDSLYYAANREKAKASVKTWRRENPERERTGNAARCKRYYVENKPRILKNVAAWREANREARRAHHSKRRARKSGAGGSFTAKDVSFLLKRQRQKCAHAWCRASLSSGFHRDHIIPLALGGSNGRRNLQLLCPPCNLRKNDKHPIDFAQQNGMLL